MSERIALPMVESLGVAIAAVVYGVMMKGKAPARLQQAPLA